MGVIRNIVEVSAETASQAIQLITDDDRTIAIKVNLCKITLDDVNQLVYIYDASQSNVAKGEAVYEPNFYVLNFNDITSPAEANANDLYTTILGYIAEAGGGGGGDATAANQTTEIARLTSILAELVLINDFTTFNAVNYNLTNLKNFQYQETDIRWRPANTKNLAVGPEPTEVALATAVTTALAGMAATYVIKTINYVVDPTLGYSAFIVYSITG